MAARAKRTNKALQKASPFYFGVIAGAVTLWGARGIRKGKLGAAAVPLWPASRA
jgi:hypothetical protein